MTLKKSYLLGILSLLLFWGCENTLKTSGKIDTLKPGAVKMAKPGESTEVTGNNLSFPVIWSDGPTVTKLLRGTYGVSIFNGITFEADGDTWYVQGHPENEWQAQSDTAVVGVPVEVSTVDWGDNLEAKAWPAGSQIRVEMVLYKTLTNPMNAYTMHIQDSTVSGTAEVWGTNTVIYPSYEATIYSGSARLVIQKLSDRNKPNLSATWDPTKSMWVGDDVGAPIVDVAAWNTVDGPGGYSAEINVQGKLIYGYNWVTRDKSLYGAGDYRITFVLDPNSGLPYNTDFDANTKILQPAETEVIPLAEPDLSGGTAYIDSEHNLTYIDVALSSEKGNKGGGQGGGQGNKGGGGGGYHGGRGQ